VQNNGHAQSISTQVIEKQLERQGCEARTAMQRLKISLNGRTRMQLSPLLILHIFGGSVGLVAGTVAIVVRKGGRWHRRAGQVFVGGMLCLAVTGALIAYMRAEPPNIVAGLLTIYMIMTAWMTGRHKDGRSGAFDWVGLVAAFGFLSYLWPLAFEALYRPNRMMNGVPAAMSFFLGTVVLLAAAGDVRMLARGGVTGARRIGRHAWRMSFGLFIATGSFFLGQQQVFPVRWRGSVALIVLGVFPLGLLLFWAVRLRFGNRFRRTVKPGFAVT
jgi:uncharacterized membrane protein